MSKILLAVLSAVIVFFMSGCGPSAEYLKSLEPLKDPKISTKADQKMIEVELKGDPSKTAGKGIGALYGVFYQLKGNKIKEAAPIARWRADVFTNRDTWIGDFGLPVSDNVNSVPPQKGDVQVKLTTWRYGEIAEILHVGPYATEMPAIERLHKYIQDKGYQIIGDHEEEYIKGPMPFFDDPKSYYTIIRYRVAKTGKK